MIFISCGVLIYKMKVANTSFGNSNKAHAEWRSMVAVKNS